jgi:hypothetical protein
MKYELKKVLYYDLFICGTLCTFTAAVPVYIYK